jgi:hypothetical protein
MNEGWQMKMPAILCILLKLDNEAPTDITEVKLREIKAGMLS